MSNNQTADQMNDALRTAGEKISPAELRAQADTLRATADTLELELDRQRRENDANETGPSNMASKAREANKPSAMKTVRKVLGWTLVVGGVTLVGAYAYAKLRDMGAGDLIDTLEDAAVEAASTVADKVDAAAAAAAAA